MKLLFRSAMRYQKQHFLQTILTLFVTLLITATISVIFHIASGFQVQLREKALQNVGEYHYYYYADTGTEKAENLRQFAVFLESDPWFSKVQLLENEDIIQLFLTVSSPGLFTSKTMEKKELAFIKTWHSVNPSRAYYGPYGKHNWDLLVSYGDLYKANGMYTYLTIFFFLIGMISLTSIFTLMTLFRISASRREREYALLISIGADQKQIRILIFLESLFYFLCSVPLGYGVGILFFYACKKNVDVLMNYGFHLPDIKLTVSLPFTIALIICEACVILISGLLTADKAAKISPMELLQKSRELHLSKSEFRETDKGKKDKRKTDILYGEKISVEKWLAKKTHQRFKRRNRFVMASLSVTFFLCMVLAGVQNDSFDLIEMRKTKQTWNLQINLQSNDLEALESMAEEINDLAGEELNPVRYASFEWNPPYPLSELAEGTEFLKANVRLPDIELICLSDDEWKSICEKNEIHCEKDNREGIFFNAEQTWMKDGKLYKGYPFHIENGDTLFLSRIRKNYDTVSDTASAVHAIDKREESKPEDIPITITGVISQIPPCVDYPAATTCVVFVPKDTFLDLEPLRPNIRKGDAIHRLSLMGMTENADQIEEAVKNYLQFQDSETLTRGEVINEKKKLLQEQEMIESFRFLCITLIVILSVVSICGNVSVSWSILASRQKEFAALLSIGMPPESLHKMKLCEIGYRIISAFIPGFLAGMIAYQFIYKMFSEEYMITWIFPWNGLLLGILIIALSTVIAEGAVEFMIKQSSLADILHEADE